MTMGRAIAALIALASAAGCVSTMVSTAEDLRVVSEDEGVAIGSVLVSARKAREDEGWLGSLAEKLDWSILIWEEAGINPIRRSFRIVVKPLKEEVFIKKLPAGRYRIDRIETVFTGGRAEDTLSFALGVHFTVKPRQTSYIGRLALEFPHRVRADGDPQVSVVDAREETLGKLRGAYDGIVADAVNDLAAR
jgi:hypothetical protein